MFVQMFSERYLVDSIKCLPNVQQTFTECCTNIHRTFATISFLDVRQMLDFLVCKYPSNIVRTFVEDSRKYVARMSDFPIFKYYVDVLRMFCECYTYVMKM